VDLGGGELGMGIGASIFLMAIGGILAWAVEFETEGVNWDTVGIILLIVGALGLLLSLLFWSSFSPYGRGTDRTVVRDREVL
jgi:hypothetical protein